MKLSRTIKHGLEDVIYAAALVLAASLLTLWLEPHLPTPPPTGIILVAVMIVSVTRGMASAATAAVLGWLAYNFFLEAPRFVFQVNSARDVYVVCIFASVGLFVGALAERLRRARRKAKLRSGELEFLFRASQRFSSISDQQVLCESLVDLMAESGCQGAYVGIYASSSVCSKSEARPDANLGELLLASRSPDTFRDGDWSARSLIAAGQPLGWAAWLSNDASTPANSRTELKVLLDIAAAALFRIAQASSN